MTNFDPVERDLNRYLDEEERAERFQSALDHEYAQVWAENFKPGHEDQDSLGEALAEHCKEGELAKHILNADYEAARSILENAIAEWCESQARIRVEARKREFEEEAGRSA